MKQEEIKLETKKTYQSPELKDLGKIGAVTNSTLPAGTVNDGGSGPNYTS